MNPILEKVILLLSVSMLFSAIYAQETAFMTFDDHISRYGLDYPTSELPSRISNFEATLGILNNFDTQGITWTPEVTKYAAWSASQIAELKGLVLEKQDNSNIVASRGVSRKLGNPSSLDWSTRRQAVSSVKNQGRCGSCWAFAAVAYAQSKLLIDDRYNSIDLSEQQLLECTKDSSCAGGYLQNSIDQLLDEVPFEALYPYDPSDTDTIGICSAGGVQVGEKAENYYYQTDLDLIELLQDRPIAISVSATNWEYYGGGIMQCSPTDPINHAVLLVGYTATYWIIKNSWGQNWGQDGYIRVDRTPGLNCRVGFSAHRTFQFNLGFLYGILLVSILFVLD